MIVLKLAFPRTFFGHRIAFHYCTQIYKSRRFVRKIYFFSSLALFSSSFLSSVSFSSTFSVSFSSSFSFSSFFSSAFSFSSSFFSSFSVVSSLFYFFSFFFFLFLDRFWFYHGLRLWDVGVEVHLFPGSIGPVITPASVLHSVHQTDEVLAVGLQVVPQRAGVVFLDHHQLSNMAVHYEVKHSWLISEEKFLVSQHLTQCLQVLLSKLLNLFWCVHS